MKNTISAFSETGALTPESLVSAGELLAFRPEADQRFRSFLARCVEPSIEYQGYRYVHVELAAATVSGYLLHLRRTAGLSNQQLESNFYLEVHTLSGDANVANIRTVREYQDGDGAGCFVMFDLPDRSFVLELSQTRCLLHDVVANTEERVMYYTELMYQAAAASRKVAIIEI